MAPLPDSNTARLFVDYRVNGTDRHTAMFRFGTDVTDAEAVAKVSDVLTEIDTAFYTDTVFENARWAATGDENSFPVPWVPINGSASPSGRPVDFRARFLSFVGRSGDGRNWHLSLFGVTLAVDANFVILDSEAPGVAAVRDALLDDPTPVLSISGDEIVALNYFTSRVSAYWQRKIARNG